MSIYDIYKDHLPKSKAVEIYKISQKIEELNLEIEKLMKLSPWFEAEYDFLKKMAETQAKIDAVSKLLSEYRINIDDNVIDRAARVLDLDWISKYKEMILDRIKELND